MPIERGTPPHDDPVPDFPLELCHSALPFNCPVAQRQFSPMTADNPPTLMLLLKRLLRKYWI
jgi:hypothetical protein